MTVRRRIRALVGDVDDTDYQFTDEDILDALLMAVPLVELDYYQGYTVNDQGTIDPTPDNMMETLFALRAAILLKQSDIAKSDRTGIFVRDGDTTIDTTKGGANKLSALENLQDQYQYAIDRLIIEGTNTVGGTRGNRVDVYTTEEL